MRLSELLFSQGFGTRRVCAGLVEQGLVRLGERRCTDPSAEVDLSAGPLRYEVQGQAWTYHPRAYLMLHKPAGCECPSVKEAASGTRPDAWSHPAWMRAFPVEKAAGLRQHVRLPILRR